MLTRFPALEPLEIAASVALAPVADPTPPASGTGAQSCATPRAALEAVVLAALERQPCMVSFSGGRDSSALLALACHVAERHGLPAPIPVTIRFPEAARTHEDQWQETVIRRLGLSEWHRVAVHDELDVLGPVATGLLRAHGLYFPPQAHFIVPAVELAAGGTVLTGTGGDELFSPWHGTRRDTWRMAAHARSRRALGHATLTASPAPMRRALHRRRLRHALPWLRPGARREVARRLARSSRPLPDFQSAVRVFLGGRNLELLRGSLQVIGDQYRVRIEHPFVDPAVALAVGAARDAGAFVDRTSAMRVLVGDLLPEESLSRGTKAVFNDVLWGRPAREFVASWSGTGVDEDLVDAEALRRAWSRETPPNRSWVLAQQAWLHQNRRLAVT